MTPVTENHDVDLTCQVGGQTGKGGWGLVTIRGDEPLLDGIIDEIRRHPSVGRIKLQSREDGIAVFTVDVVRCKACEALIRSKSFMVFPVEIRKGRMKWLLITDNNRSIGTLIDQLAKHQCDVRIERVTPLSDKGVLTGRQEEVIRKAFSLGYFDYPRRTDSMMLAKELGVSVSTLSEVMRAAQRRIFAEYVRS
ncbi:MAG TPA: helix-turn-helix domain-containing protein [Nitrososphaerales archaeon]|nr:helix-turn-helix domain-containing protein [Nitrososphaerales archaeon]